jgi:hypothetical protein
VTLLPVFCGYDPREREGFDVFVRSVIATSPGVALVPQSGRRGDGTTTFSYSRFLTPELMGYKGWAVSLDGSDMLVREDLFKLFALADGRYAVQVVKHEYGTRHPRKFVGTPMEAPNPDYPRKNWSSVILWNCAHPAHRRERYTADGYGPFYHRFGWLRDEEIGALPIEWNWLADEYGVNRGAKLLHWTVGIPGFEHYRNAPHADEWREMKERA